MKNDISKIKDALNALGDTLEDLSNREQPKLEILDRALSGNKIHGGRITQFQSVGIVDEATKPSLHVNDRGIKTVEIRASRWEGDAEFTGNLSVAGDLTVDGLHVKKITSDNRLERSSSLNFVSDDDQTIIGKGLQWKEGDEPAKQFVYRGNDDRLWSSENLDLQKGKSYKINNHEVLNEDTLGSGITKSNLRKVGTLQGLQVIGDVNIDEFLHWSSDSSRLGIGTDAPNAMLSLASYEAEFIVDVDREHVRVGTWTTDDLHFVTDDTDLIVITRSGKITLGTRNRPTVTTAYGSLNVNVNNPSGDVDIETAGPIRIAGQRFSIGDEPPTAGAFKQGDIVWNKNPKPTGWAGWICVRPGAPGVWKPFGQIGS